MASKVDQQLRDGAAFSTKSSIPVSQGDLNKGLADLSWNQKKGHKHTLSFKSYARVENFLVFSRNKRD